MSPDQNDPPTPPAQPPQRRLFRMPEWFRNRTPGSPPTAEERARLAEWFREQLRERPLPEYRPPDKPDKPEPPSPVTLPVTLA